MPGGGVYGRIISAITRVRIRPNYIAGKYKDKGVGATVHPMPFPEFSMAPKKGKPAKILGAGPIEGRGGGTIVYPENQDNIRRGKAPTIKYTPPPVTHRPAKPKPPKTQILGSGPVRPTIEYPEQQTIAVKRPKPERGTIKYPDAPRPATTGHGGAKGPKPPVKPRFEAKFERENR
tara:strand:- start:1803 stop:2330 length:528 start_codon:yes stop_codon:yes gene_type:complete